MAVLRHGVVWDYFYHQIGFHRGLVGAACDFYSSEVTVSHHESWGDLPIVDFEHLCGVLTLDIGRKLELTS